MNNHLSSCFLPSYSSPASPLCLPIPWSWPEPCLQHNHRPLLILSLGVHAVVCLTFYFIEPFKSKLPSGAGGFSFQLPAPSSWGQLGLEGRYIVECCLPALALASNWSEGSQYEYDIKGSAKYSYIVPVSKTHSDSILRLWRIFWHC